VAIVLDALTEEKTGEEVEKREEKLLPRLAGLAGLFQGLEGAEGGGGGVRAHKSKRREVEVELLVLLEDEFRKLAKGKSKVDILAVHCEYSPSLPTSARGREAHP